MEIEGQSIRFEIFDKTYTIKGVFEDDYKEKLETFVDHTIREISKRLQTVDRDKIVVTATLNIAHYLFQDKIKTIKRNQSKKMFQRLRPRLANCQPRTVSLKLKLLL